MRIPELAPAFWSLTRAPGGRALLVGVLSGALLAGNTAFWRSEPLRDLRHGRRLFEDLSAAISHHFRERDPGPVKSFTVEDGQVQIDRYLRRIDVLTTAEGIRPWQFWRTIPMGRFAGYPQLLPRESDDPGRSILLALAFGLRGGVAPFLGLWLCALLALPVLVLTSYELFLARAPVAALLFPLALASSPFVVETFSLAYSAVGFYVVGLVALVPLAVHAVTGPCRLGGLSLRVLFVGGVFGVCALCRSGTLLLAPGFLLAIAIGAWRAPGLAARSRLLAAGGLAVLFLMPSALMRPRQHHELWLGVWEGLGDFDRTKGHVWLDLAAKDFLRSAGFDVPRGQPLQAVALKYEAFFRERVLTEIAGDPRWFAGILARRTWATVTQEKLRPYGPRDGNAFAPSTAPNEGMIDTYYGFATTVDHFGLGPWRFEVPVALLLLPTLLLLALWAASHRRPRWRAWAPRLDGFVAVLGSMVVAAAVSPVLITTASAIETQAFVLAYLLGAALLGDAVAARPRA